MTNPTSPGWYDDPDAPDQLRYFDGVLWSRHTAPRSTRAVPPVTAVSPVDAGSAAPGAGAGAERPGGDDPYGWRGGHPGANQPTQQPYGQPPQQYGQPPQQWGQPPQQWGQPGQVPGWGAAGARPTGPATPDGVPLAGYWQRVGAFILDGLITAVITFILGGYFLMRALQPWLDAFTQALNSTDPTAFENLSQDLSVYMTGSDFYTFVGISVIVGLIYHVAFLTRFGATPGKMAMRISVRRRDTPGPLPLPVAVRRYFLTLATAVLGTLPGALSALALLVRMVDLLFPAWDPQRQALHDKIAATNVVQGKQVRQRD